MDEMNAIGSILSSSGSEAASSTEEEQELEAELAALMQEQDREQEQQPQEHQKQQATAASGTVLKAPVAPSHDVNTGAEEATTVVEESGKVLAV